MPREIKKSWIVFSIKILLRTRYVLLREMLFSYVVVFLLFSSIRSYNIAPNDRYEDPKFRKNFAEFHCFKLRTCSEGGDRVCAFDEYDAKLAVFEDLCTLYKFNCDGKGFFLKVDMHICDRQRDFEREHNITTPSPSTSRQRIILRNPFPGRTRVFSQY